MNSVRYMIVLISICLCTEVNKATACSVCRCGDNAFQFSDKGFALPDQGARNHFDLSFGNLYSSKSNAFSGNDGSGTEHQREFRPSFRFTYYPLENLSFAVDAPLQFRRNETATSDGVNRVMSSGFGDAELSTVWMRNILNYNGQFYTGGISIALKLPTGNNIIRESGVRLDEHLQAGTGAYDWQMGGALSRVTCESRYFTSLYYRRNGANSFSYHYGNAFLYNFGGQWPLTDRLSGSVQANGRYAARDINHNFIEDNTGGQVIYIAPGIKMNISEAAAVSAAIQIPVYQHLYGTQSEKAVFSAGINISL